MNLIIILGAARSGTTFLGREALSYCNNLAYWGEPYHVWMHGNAYRRHDVLAAEDVTPSIANYISHRMNSRLRSSGCDVLLEKTPSNCLRIPFIRKIFPDARFIHLTRNGRHAIRSTVLEWQGEGQDAIDSHELRIGGRLSRVGKGLLRYTKIIQRIQSFTDLVELPAYLPRVGRFVMRNCTHFRDYQWGPRFPGMMDYRRRHTLWETCSEQWRWQVDSVLDHTADLGLEKLYTLQFEDLMANPKQELSSVADWMEVEMEETALNRIISSIQPRKKARKDPFSSLDFESKAKVEAIILPAMKRLGYCDE